MCRGGLPTRGGFGNLFNVIYGLVGLVGFSGMDGYTGSDLNRISLDLECLTNWICHIFLFIICGVNQNYIWEEKNLFFF